jgi:hypothetical protein
MWLSRVRSQQHRACTAALLLCYVPIASAPLQTQAIRTFDRTVLLEEQGETSAGVSIGDLNGDGRLDLILAKGRHWPLHDRVLIADGSGGFSASNLGTVPDRTYSAALADIDRDGDLDIVVSNDAPDRKLIYKNDGRGRFVQAGTFGDQAWSTRYVTLADLDGDRYPDIVAANRGGDKPTPSFACRNDRHGRFPSCEPLATESATSIVASDLDGDGAIDLFVPHRDGGQSLVLWNDGKGRFATSAKVGAAVTNARIGAAGDLDRDGRPDLVFIEESKKATFYMLNRGGRQFGDPVQLPGPPRTPYALALGDLNRDGQLDIVVGHVKLPGSIYYNEGKGRAFREIGWNDGKGVVYGMVFADVNGDTWPDIIAARSDAPNAIWYSGKPNLEK